jgi:sulfate permease, SulP family
VIVGVEQGIIVAMVVSLLRIVSHSYHPHSGVLMPDGAGWKRVPPMPGAMTEPGLVIYSFGAPLFYANASRFAEQARTLVDGHPSPVRWFIVDCEAIPNIDYTAARVVCDLQHQLAKAGVTLGFARMAPSLLADFDRHHITELVGRQLLFQRLHDAVAAYEESHQITPPSTR